MRVTIAARAMPTGRRSEGARECANAAQSSIVAAEAQVPGPGFMRPMPKKVAIRSAQRGVGATEGELILCTLPPVERSYRRSAAVLGGCRAGVPPAHPNPAPILQVCFVGISRLFVHTFGRAIGNQFLGVGDWRLDHIRSACPLAQIDGAAAIAAKGELGVAALDCFLADGAAEFQGLLARHGEGSRFS